MAVKNRTFTIKFSIRKSVVLGTMIWQRIECMWSTQTSLVQKHCSNQINISTISIVCLKCTKRKGQRCENIVSSIQPLILMKLIVLNPVNVSLIAIDPFLRAKKMTKSKFLNMFTSIFLSINFQMSHQQLYSSH